MNIEDVQKFIEENKDSEEVQSFLSGFKTPLDVETVQEYLETDEGRKTIQPLQDKYFAKGLETWKQKTLPTVLEEEIRKRFPEETQEQRELRELKDRLTQMESEKKRESLKSRAIQQLTAKKLPVSLLQFVLNGDSEEVISDNINNIEKEINQTVQSLVENEVAKRFRSTAGNPQDGGSQGKSLSRTEFMRLDPAAQMKAVKDGYQITETQ